MKRVVFYSWQSDLPNATNRGFIQRALEGAAAAIAADGSVAVEPVIDRDTLGVPGSPDIASTIFAKITAADVVVADITITGRPAGGRPTPNPNVLIELGYALKAVGPERVILVFNRAFGKIEELPFDLRMRRLIPYDMPESEKQRSPERSRLEGLLNTAIRVALEHVPATAEALAIPAVTAIEGGQANRILVLRRDLDKIFGTLADLEPQKYSAGGTADTLIEALGRTEEAAAEFSKIVETIAGMNDSEAVLEVCRWFGRVLERYELPPGHSGRVSDADCDYFKFVGHELFVSLIAFLLRERRWEVIRQVLDEPIPVRHLRREHGPGTVSWEEASDHLALLLDESRRRKRVCLHADILSTRHTTGGLAAILPFEDFIAADLFLFLCGALRSDQGSFMAWRPWSALYLKQTPMFLRAAERKSTAETLAKTIGVPSVPELKRRLKERGPGLRELFRNYWTWPIEDEDVDRIGSR
jgi:hypothetical protein